MSDVFISYARETEAYAKKVADALRAVGLGVWYDEDLPAHRAFSEVIEERLREAKAVIVIWSAEAVKSEWVRAEADTARKAHKLVQLNVDKSDLPLPFSQIQCVDLAGWNGNADSPGWRKVIASVGELVGRTPPTPQPVDVRKRPTAPLLAVLAFDNLSGDADMAYFSDGVSEEIQQTIARAANLKVIGRSSSFQFRGADKAVRRVSSELKVTHVLDGSVRRSGQRVRISAQLVECADETMLWSDRFDRDLVDVFAVQDEIAGAVADALKIAFSPSSQSDAVDPTAYNLYLKALELRNKGLEADARSAVIRMLEEATRRAPGFARAWAFLAMILAQGRLDEPKQFDTAWRASVVTAAETALKLDPTLGTAYQALGQLEAIASYSEREALHRKALSVAPNDPTVLTNASLFFTEIGRIRDGLEYARHAYDLDPKSPWAANWYANTLVYAGRLDQGRALFARLCAAWPDNELLSRDSLYCATYLRDWTWFDALVETARDRKLSSRDVRQAISFGIALRESRPDLVARLLKRAHENLTRLNFVPLSSYTALYSVGMADEVFALIDQSSFAFMFDRQMRPPSGGPSVGQSDGVIFSVLFNGSMMRDIRFVRLCAKLGLCDYWAKTDRWPDCAEAVGSFYDFKAEARRLAIADSR